MTDQGFYIPQKDVQKLRERIAELESIMADFCNTYDECPDESVDVSTDYFYKAFRKALGGKEVSNKNP